MVAEGIETAGQRDFLLGQRMPGVSGLLLWTPATAGCVGSDVKPPLKPSMERKAVLSLRSERLRARVHGLAGTPIRQSDHDENVGYR